MNSNLDPILHHLATIHPLQTDNNYTRKAYHKLDCYARPLHKYGWLYIWL